MGLPDERSRGSVANLIGRFEKQNKPADGGPSTNSTPPKVVLPNRAFPPVKKLTEGGGSPAPSWLKKKEEDVPPAVPKEDAPVQAGTDATQATVPAPEPAPAESTIVAEPEPEPAATVDLSDDKVATPAEPKDDPPVEEAAPGGPSKEERVATPARSTASPTKPNSPSKIARPVTAGSKVSGAAKPSPSVAKTSRPTTTPAKTTSATPSSLSKAKSTPSLKKAPDSASTTPSRKPTLKSKDSDSPAQPVKPQPTGTGSTITARRVVSSAVGPSSNGTKIPAASGSPAVPKAPATRIAKVSGSSTLYAPTASMLAKQRKDELTAPPSAGKKAAALSGPGTRPRAGSTSGPTTGLKPLQLPLKSSVSASGTRRMVSVSRSARAGPSEGGEAAATGSRAGTMTPTPRGTSPTKSSPLKPFPSRSPTKTPLARAQMGGTARITKNAAVGAWAGAVAAAVPDAVTSEEELILSGEKTAPQGSGMEEGAQQQPGLEEVPVQVTDRAAVSQEPEELKEEAKAGHHVDLEDTAAALAPSTVDQPTTPEPEAAAVPIVEPTPLEEPGSKHAQQPEQDELEQMVNMLEAPRKALHFGASSDEDEPAPTKKPETAISDIPSDG